MSVAVGLDVGTSSLKGVALSEDGAVVAVAHASYPLSTPRPGWSEQDPELWWEAAQVVLAQLREAAGPVAGIGLSGQMHGLVALDAADRPVRPAILWNDQRTAFECAEIETLLGGAQRVLELTGNPVLTGFTAPKLQWMWRNEPELHRQVRRVMLPKDYVRLRLCGEHATDVTDASGTLWFDVAQRRWSTAVLEALEIDEALMVPALESSAATGATPDGAVVAAGAGDQAAGALGVGALEPTTASVVVGTSGVVLAPLGGYVADARVQGSCHVVDGTWFAMAVMLSAAGSLGWLHDVIGDVPYETLLAEAAACPPGADGVSFLPYLSGERSPYPDPDARGAFTGLALGHGRGAIARAVLEGVAFGLRDVLDVVSDATGARPQTARLSGGGARGELWPAIFASALDLPLTRVTVDEGAALGAALLGGVAAGMWADTQEAVAAAVRTGETVEPDPAWVAVYAQAREHYRALYPALAAVR
jgi:xylulokinase